MTPALVLAAIAPPAVCALRAAPAGGETGRVRFAVIGDSGSGGRMQYQVARQLTKSWARDPFDFVLMLGDNLYGASRPKDYQANFVLPYGSLLEAGVKFYAVLGNHDAEAERFYPGFNMNGRRYYCFTSGEDLAFFALDSSCMDAAQLDWLERALAGSAARWKICYLHHPLYSSGRRHGSDVALRRKLEPLLIRYGVAVVFSGHDHFYERTRPQSGIQYFVSGAAGKLRRGNPRTVFTAASFDDDNHFLLIEIAGSVLHFEAINRLGNVVDSGLIETRTGIDAR